MKKLIKIIPILLLFTFVFVFPVNAASTSLSAPSTAKVEDTITVSATIKAAQWKLSLKVNGTEVASSIELDNYSSNIEKTIKGTYKAGSKGNLSVTLTGTITDVNGTTTNVNDKKTITVEEKTNNSGGGSSGGQTGGEGENPTTTPKFTSVNEKVYAKKEVNVRKSWTTTSSKLGTLQEGDEITRTGKGDNGWSRVSYNGSTAYVNSDYLTTTKPNSDEKKSTNKALKSLTVEPTGLTPKFDKETTKYTLKVGYDISELKVTAEPEDSKAKVEVTGNKKLNLGENIVKIAVTAEDGTVRTYMITVTKEAEESLLLLKNLTIEGTTLIPDFTPSIYEYTVNVKERDITQLNITAETNDSSAKVEIIGNENLKPGENVITILLTPEESSEEKVTYQIKVILPLEEQTMLLSNFTVSPKLQMGLYVICGVVAITVLIISILFVIRYRTTREEAEEEETKDETMKTEPEEGKPEEIEIKEENTKKQRKPTIDDLYDVPEEVKESKKEEKTRRQKKTTIDDLYDVPEDTDEVENKKTKRGKHF